MNFEQAFDRLIGHEGGYVNDARDPGGETKFGISKRAYPTLDIKNITVEDAKRIYRRDYWERAKCDLYDAAIGFQLFDAAVNSGYDNASRFLQRAVGVADDGKIGPVTVAAINEMLVTDVLARFNAERLLFYTKLSTWPTYGKGWARRIAQNLLYSSEDA
jgi:lysozyme family protein